MTLQAHGKRKFRTTTFLPFLRCLAGSALSVPAHAQSMSAPPPSICTHRPFVPG